jgi:hypothetical protein
MFGSELDSAAELVAAPERAPHWRARPLPFSELEDAQLRRLVYQAFDLRETPYFRDACEAILDWNDRTLPDRLERRARRAASFSCAKSAVSAERVL